MRGLRDALAFLPPTPYDALYRATMPTEDPAPLPTREPHESPISQTVPVPPPPAKVPPRLTVVETVVYERADHSAAQVRAAFDCALVSAEQVYRREQTVKSDGWTPLDTGWLGAGVSRVVVENAGKTPGASFLYVGFGTGRPGPETIHGLSVAPGQAVTFAPYSTGRTWLCADYGRECPVVVTAVPS